MNDSKGGKGKQPKMLPTIPKGMKVNRDVTFRLPTIKEFFLGGEGTLDDEQLVRQRTEHPLEYPTPSGGMYRNDTHINGNNGSSTNSDDVLPKRPQKRPTAPPKRRPLRKVARLPRKIGIAPIGIHSARQTDFDRVIAAPAAVGNMSQPYLRFSSARRGELNGIRVHGYQRFAQLFAYTGISFSSVAINNSFGISTLTLGKPLSLIGAAFLRYKFTHLRFEFKSAAGSNINGSVTMGWDGDGYSTATASISQPAISSLADSVESNIWLNSQVHASLIKDDNLFYTYSVGTAPADYRNALQGCVLVNGQQGSFGQGSAIGDIWAEYEVEMYDLSDENTITYLKTGELSRKLEKLVNPRSTPSSKFYVPDEKDNEQYEELVKKINLTTQSILPQTTPVLVSNSHASLPSSGISSMLFGK